MRTILARSRWPWLMLLLLLLPVMASSALLWPGPGTVVSVGLYRASLVGVYDNGRPPSPQAQDVIPGAQAGISPDATRLPLAVLASGATAAAQKLPVPVRIGFPPDARPLSFADGNGKPEGLASDYLLRLRQAGASLWVQPSRDGYELREKMRAGELEAAIAIADDSRYLGADWVFSDPFVNVPNVIVTGKRSDRVLRIADLSGQRVLLSDPERLRARVLQQAPAARIVAARSAEQALQRLADGDAQAYIGNRVVIERLLRGRFAGQLQIAAPAGFEDHLSLAVQRRHAALVTRFNRMLQDMGPQEQEALRNAWLSAAPGSGTDWHAVTRWVAPLSLVLLAALLVRGLNQRRLRQEIAARRRLEQRLADITHNLPAVIYQMRRLSDGRLEFPYVAGDMQAVFGIDASQAMASSCVVLDAIDARDRDAVQAAIEHAARDFLPLALEFRTSASARPDAGSPRWVRSQAQPHASQAGAVTWSGYWMDVTQAHAQADALVEAKAVAEQAAIAKARFLATMSHEIRTPMSGVLGMLEMLAHSPLHSAQRMHVADAEQAARELRQMLDDILDYARMDAGALHLDPLPLPLRPLLEALHRHMAPLAAGRGLHLRLDTDPRLAGAHEVDGLRLRQILRNLLDNALRFTWQGEVALGVRVLEGSTASLQELCFQVTDSGPGIEAERLAVLFPADAPPPEIVPEGGRTGLGLTICQRLVRLMGGRLRARSVAGSGTRVEVLLPLPVASDEDVAATLPGPGSVPPLPESLRSARVLVVEDHPTAQAMMAWRLQQLGIAHAVAGNGREALQQLAATRFDLVITDCRMPVMDGYAFTRLLREREERQRDRRLPVVALTASVLEDDLRRCRDAGMDEVLTKPLSLAHLRQCLLRWLPPDGRDGTLRH